MTVLENLRIPLEYAARRRTERRRILDDSMEVLELIGLKDRANDNSAGLTQVDMRKLELARALAAKPRLLVSDEAMAGLSSAEVDEILEILLALNAEAAQEFLPGLEWPAALLPVAQRFWPGPLTVVVPCDDAPEGLRGPGGGVAIRVTPDPTVRAILRAGVDEVRARIESGLFDRDLDDE